MNKRPNLDKEISIEAFKDFYWLKEELLAFCRKEGLKRSGGKIEITQRIEDYLKTGTKKDIKKNINPSRKSNFDWNSEKLTLKTKITDNYKNTEQVRNFFQQEIGKPFKFNVQFMNWMKSNEGKTLEDAIAAWKKIKEENKTSTSPKEIAPQFEYNRYLRDYLANNPEGSRAIGIKLWKLKKSRRGDNKYRKSDLKLLREIKNRQNDY